MQPGLSRRDVSVSTTRPCGVTERVQDINGLQNVTFTLKENEFTYAFLVWSVPANAPGLLFTDFLEKACALIDFECGKKSLTGISNVPRVLSVPHALHAALRVKMDAAFSAMRRHSPEQVSANLHPGVTLRKRNPWLVRARKNIVVAPRCRHIVVGRLEFDKDQTPFVCLRTASSNSY